MVSLKQWNTKNYFVSDELNISRVSLQCRRGMLELDFLLERFLQNKYPSLPHDQQAVFVRLLTYSDPQLLAWLTGIEVPDDVELAVFVTRWFTDV